MDKRKAVG